MTNKCDHIVREEHDVHPDHDNHTHGEDCGHTAVVHMDSHGCEHVDYVHKDDSTGETHLHHDCEEGNDHYHECSLEDQPKLVDGLSTLCMSFSSCADHGIDPCGSTQCAHEAVPHDGHDDYLVPSENTFIDDQDNLVIVEGFDVHCPHDDHCDNRGFLPKAFPAP